MSSTLYKILCGLVFPWTAVIQPGSKFAIAYVTEFSTFKVMLFLLSPIFNLYARSSYLYAAICSTLYVIIPPSSQWVACMSAASLNVKLSVVFAFVVVTSAVVESIVYDPSLLWLFTPKALGSMFVETVRIFSILWYFGWWRLKLVIWLTEDEVPHGYKTGVVREAQYEKEDYERTARPMPEDGKDGEDDEEKREYEEMEGQKIRNVLKKTLLGALTLVGGCTKGPENDANLCPPSPIKRSDTPIKPFDASPENASCVSLQKYAFFNRVSTCHSPCAFEILEYEREKIMLNKVLTTPPKKTLCWNLPNPFRSTYRLANSCKQSSRTNPIPMFPEKPAWIVCEEKEMKVREMRLEAFNPLHSEMLKKNIFGTWDEATHKYYWEKEETGPRYNFA